MMPKSLVITASLFLSLRMAVRKPFLCERFAVVMDLFS